MCPRPSIGNEAQTVVDCVARGDRQSLTTLFAAYCDYLRHVVDIRMNESIRSRVDPADIVQEAQLEALRRAEDYAANPKLLPHLWLRQIAIDRLTMAYRQHLHADKRSVLHECPLPVESLAFRLVSGKPSPHSIAESQEIGNIVRAAIAELNVTDREILILQGIEGLSSHESAQVLGIRPEAARRRYARAMLRLRGSLPAHLRNGGDDPA